MITQAAGFVFKVGDSVVLRISLRNLCVPLRPLRLNVFGFLYRRGRRDYAEGRRDYAELNVGHYGR